jgi:hypothetical protein
MMSDWVDSERLGRMLDGRKTGSGGSEELGQLIGLGFEIGKSLGGQRVRSYQREDISRRIEALLETPWWQKEIKRFREDRDRQAVAAGGLVVAAAGLLLAIGLARRSSKRGLA